MIDRIGTSLEHRWERLACIIAELEHFAVHHKAIGAQSFLFQEKESWLEASLNGGTSPLLCEIRFGR